MTTNYDGTEGQDRKSYTDTQDRKSYAVTSNKGFVFTVSVYSAFSVRTKEPINVLQRYLYDHTELTSNLYYDLKDGEVDPNGFCHGVLVTTVHGISEDTDAPEHGTRFAKAVQTCRGVVDYQNDRLASGLIAAQRCGTQAEAEAWCADRCSIT